MKAVLCHQELVEMNSKDQEHHACIGDHPAPFAILPVFDHENPFFFFRFIELNFDLASLTILPENETEMNAAILKNLPCCQAAIFKQRTFLRRKHCKRTGLRK